MASTTTNKQPLLVDRVFHKVTDMKGGSIGKDDRVDLSSTNNAKLLLDCTTTDGAVVAEIYTLARDTSGNTGNVTPWIINFYMTASNSVLAAADAKFLGFMTCGEGASATSGERIFFAGAPYILFPVPAVGSVPAAGGDVVGTQFQALYIPKGFALWAGVNAKEDSNGDAVDASATTAPVCGVQGGFY
tara:strand:- start:561 stop:1124 length:564 start_codon:yes stop_codon:yes gene_type:complete